MRRGISPILATVILIAITLIAAVMIAAFVFGLFGTFTTNPGIHGCTLNHHTITGNVSIPGYYTYRCVP